MSGHWGCLILLMSESSCCALTKSCCNVLIFHALKSREMPLTDMLSHTWQWEAGEAGCCRSSVAGLANVDSVSLIAMDN